MFFFRTLMLSTAFLALGSVTYGIDLKYYWLMEGLTQRRVCRDAVRKNPDVVRQLQATAERCMKQIQSELAALAARHPSLTGIGQVKMEQPGANDIEKVFCGLQFEKKTRIAEVPSGSLMTTSGFKVELEKDGCILVVWVNNILGYGSAYKSCNFSERYLVHEIEINVSYYLRLSKENGDCDKIVRALLEKRVKDMSEELKKLQTAEDRKAGDEF